MDCQWCQLFGWAVVVYMLVQFLRLLFSDCDLNLQWATQFGKKIDTLSGNVVWITGASAGIGEHVAYTLARAGCRLVLTARRPELLQTVKDKCLKNSSLTEDDILLLPFDVTDVASHETHTQSVLEHFGKIDILFNNAGRSQRALVMDTSLELDREMFELNVFSVISLTKAVLPHMVQKNKGHIVVTSSLAGKFGVTNSATYAASKHALQGWLDSLRMELYEKNILVTAVCAGPVHSNVQSEAMTGTPGQKYGAVVGPPGLERRVETARCADLIGVTMANQLDEVWIALQPLLLLVVFNQYFSTFGRWVTKKMGNKVLSQLREGKEVFDKEK